MPTRMGTAARIRFMLPVCFEGGTAGVVGAVSGAAVTLVSVGEEAAVSVVLLVAAGGAAFVNRVNH